ncbi:MAG: bifunctional demethylmenaquinone methyltransferase/2-methoxy-6-polyprenyl-1,4-benzoquinol methylase UbiE [Nitrospira sp. SB0677_bin_15]|nr:bifunctional demethylmenaquinone methyltransferase/2-methoxy-6-polyprenyl-1,4-benzoquinol methylase UbiE [Nitrospira sp. SB0667_bin_9]MYD31779.1 bifunctional demethylmenaquinone methyltransferase/2-methoxy-6-polyprenyl-1,4-benzoquinol methylase UbiE [Nitrospira sp. SB0661_bin_20]MYG40719.1 bifunctional demethylmenaquinone methyltransferase/2-methoxy-6-polyprenyl-1,4-benzoquinol methylase UbiE [Nitrospira sp. SB0677_bin_15]MYH02989.1 bifunctional demethylmenaquinone methyltransferase/2-methoxy
MPSIEHAASDSTGKAVSQWSGQSREQAVQHMFTAIAARYDLNNSLLSFGLHHRWKALAAGLIPMLTHGRALDLGAGTGDLALLLDRRMGEHGRVVAMDLNFAMLRVGTAKIARRSLASRIACFRGNAEWITFRDDTFDAVTAGFCIRNVGDRPRAFREIYRVLKPGGRFVCLEFSRPVSAWLRRVYDWYSFHLLPAIGTWVAKDHTDVYRYLPESIRTFPDQEALAAMLREAGFGLVEYHNLSGGIVAIHVAVKPVNPTPLAPLIRGKKKGRGDRMLSSP